MKVLDTVEVVQGHFLQPCSLFDMSQTDTYIYVATERLVPLQWPAQRKVLSEETLKWGLFTIAVGYGSSKVTPAIAERDAEYSGVRQR